MLSNQRDYLPLKALLQPARLLKPKASTAMTARLSQSLARRRTKGVGRIAARTIAQLVAHAPLTMRQIVNETVPYRMFPDATPELTA